MNRNDYFGARRSISNRQEDFGYADMMFATGDQGRIIELQERLEIKNDELVTLESNLSKKNSKLSDAREHLKQGKEWMYKKGGLCKTWYSKNKCDDTRRAYQQSTINPRQSIVNGLVEEVRAINIAITATKQEIDKVAKEMESLLKAQELEAESTLVLAKQGTTAEEIKINAKSEAEKKQRKSKSTRTIVLTLVLSAVLLAGIYAYYRIKKSN